MSKFKSAAKAVCKSPAVRKEVFLLVRMVAVIVAAKYGVDLA